MLALARPHEKFPPLWVGVERFATDISLKTTALERTLINFYLDMVTIELCTQLICLGMNESNRHEYSILILPPKRWRKLEFHRTLLVTITQT